MARDLALVTGLDVATDRSVPDQASRGTLDSQLLQATVRRFLEALARRRPLCLMVEDIHWADEALLDLIEFIAARAQEAPLLILTQARPELLEKRPAWGRGLRAFTALPLEPLDADAAQVLTAALCRERGLAEDAIEQVRRVAGGNPLFAEELVAMIAERGAAGGLPGVIKALISARLDALPAAERSALRLASVFGKTFWGAGLRALGVTGEVAPLLESLEARDLLRLQPRSQLPGEREYAFKHDLIRDVAYETLPRAERRRLHGRAADWIEQVCREQTEAPADLLAHHAAQAGQEERALDYLMRAATRAGQAAAYREEASLLARAIEIAERLGQAERVIELRGKRGNALSNVSLWRQARPELEAALTGIPAERPGQRAEVMVDLARICFWLFEGASLRRHATEALALATRAARADLAPEARGWVAAADVHDGDVAAALEGFRQAWEEALESAMIRRPYVWVFRLPALYWTAQFDDAITYGQEVLRLTREGKQIQTALHALSFLGLALAGRGRYVEALGMFEEGERLGREYNIGPNRAICNCMWGGLHLDLYDFSGAEARAHAARELALSTGFPPAIYAAGIDLLVNHVRCDQPDRAEALLEEVARGVASALGPHGWLWQIRMANARAEIALAREQWEEAVRLADGTIAMSRAKGRVKYTVAGLGTRGKALAGARFRSAGPGRTREAIADLRAGVDLARPTGDPAMLLRAATALLAIEGDDALLAEARGAAERIAAALPGGELRERFLASEPVRRLGRTAR